MAARATIASAAAPTAARPGAGRAGAGASAGAAPGGGAAAVRLGVGPNSGPARGGPGRDTFVIEGGSSEGTTLVDFTPGEDKISVLLEFDGAPEDPYSFVGRAA